MRKQAHRAPRNKPIGNFIIMKKYILLAAALCTCKPTRAYDEVAVAVGAALTTIASGVYIHHRNNLFDTACTQKESLEAQIAKNVLNFAPEIHEGSMHAQAQREQNLTIFADQEERFYRHYANAGEYALQYDCVRIETEKARLETETRNFKESLENGRALFWETARWKQLRQKSESTITGAESLLAQLEQAHSCYTYYKPVIHCAQLQNNLAAETYGSVNGDTLKERIQQHYAHEKFPFVAGYRRTESNVRDLRAAKNGLGSRPNTALTTALRQNDLDAQFEAILHKIAVFPEFTRDKQAELNHQHEQERLELLRRQANASEENARTQEKLVRAQERGNALLAEKNSLAAKDLALRTAELVAHAGCNRRIRELEDRICTLRTQLYMQSDLDLLDAILNDIHTQPGSYEIRRYEQRIRDLENRWRAARRILHS